MDSDDQKQAEQAERYCDLYEQALYESRWGYVDELLSAFDAEKLEQTASSAILVVLSLTWHAKEHLTQRESFVVRAESALTAKLGAERTENLMRLRR